MATAVSVLDRPNDPSMDSRSIASSESVGNGLGFPRSAPAPPRIEAPRSRFERTDAARLWLAGGAPWSAE